MCQYSAPDSLLSDWHFAHLAARAAGGAGIVFTEAVHTGPRGRITPFDLGLWNDQQRDRMRRLTEFIDSQDAVPGIQLGHAGRKALTTRPWEGTRPLPPAEGGWEVIAPLPVPFAEGWPTPAAMTPAMIRQSLDDLAAAVRRAGRRASAFSKSTPRTDT